jgi:uncharacterized protein DUF4410
VDEIGRLECWKVGILEYLEHRNIIPLFHVFTFHYSIFPFPHLTPNKRGDCMLEGIRNLRPLAALGLAALLISGCATDSVTPRFPATQGLPRPDRVLVNDFAVTAADAGVDPSIRSTTPQTEAEIQVGRALAKALSKNLLSELRSRDITAFLASETSPPGETTVSIRGQFMRIDPRAGTAVVGFGFSGSGVRTHVQVFQGAGLSLSLVGEADAVTPSGLTAGTAPGATVDADAGHIAKDVADRVINYYRQQGWIK